VRDYSAPKQPVDSRLVTASVYGDSLRYLGSSVDVHRQARAVPFPRKLAGKIREEENVMLRWALIFLVVAIVAGIFGFAGIMMAAAGIAKLLFYLFLVLFLVSLVMGLVSRT
jgi:uncharacterized membrane protein YtjA (UPF0391 family)